MGRGKIPIHPVVDGIKQCITCGQHLPVNRYYVSRGRLMARCKECISVRDKQERSEAARFPMNKPKSHPIVNGTRQCIECGAVKPLDEFNWKKMSIGKRDIRCASCRSEKTRRERVSLKPPAVVNGKRLCRSCGEWKTIDLFYKKHSKGMEGKLYSRCIECTKFASSKAGMSDEAYQRRMERQEKWREQTPGYNRQSHLKRNYGLSLDEYQAMSHEQGDACSICGTVYSDSLVVDHDHATGEVRGLLCGKCNSGIGLLQDNPVLLMAAAVYLQTKTPAFKKLLERS